MTIRVVKRCGTSEPLDIEKIHKVLSWACEGLDNVSVSSIEMKSRIQFFDGIKTEAIHDTLIKTASNLIELEAPNYQYVAARLGMFQLRKKVLKQFDPLPIYDLVKRNVELGVYDPAILELYTEEEFDEFDSFIDHDRDFTFTYSAFKQLEDKYLVQNKVTHDIYETPQYLYVLCAATIFSKYDRSVRMKYVKDFYDATSQFYISLPTPILAGVRTALRQYSSCVLVESGDSLDSINATASVITKYASQRAGLGIGTGRIRALGSPVKGGQIYHTGITPFLKMFQAALKSCNQGGVRTASATVFFPIWHREIDTVLSLKNNKGTEDSRVRHVDYGIQINGFFYKKYLKNEDMYIFCPNSVDDMYEAFFDDQDLFVELYEKYSNDPSISKLKVSAREVFEKLGIERSDTSRYYVQNVDNCSKQSGFNEHKVRLRQSNLCVEIVLPTKPLQAVDDPDGVISLCILAAFNLGLIKNPKDFEKYADLIVRALDELIDYQEYPIIAAELTAKKYRSLGVGVINYAYFLAKNNLKYTPDAYQLTHQYFEAMQYYLMKASCNLAKEKGPCTGFTDTKWADGLLPIDTYKRTVDEYANFSLDQDWEKLRADIKTHGMRNCTLSALMPSESSSVLSNATNGIEPPRALVSVKESRTAILKQVSPDVKRIKNKIQLLWDMGTNAYNIRLIGIMQKFICQSASANLSYNPEFFPDHKIPLSYIMTDILDCYKYGLKTIYYSNIFDRSDEEAEAPQEDGCAGGACKI